MKKGLRNASPLFVTPPGGLREQISASARLSWAVRLWGVGGCARAGAPGPLWDFRSSHPICPNGLGAGLRRVILASLRSHKDCQFLQATLLLLNILLKSKFGSEPESIAFPLTTELPWASPHGGGMGGEGGGRQPELGAGMGQGRQGNAVFTLTPREGPGLGKTPSLQEISALPFPGCVLLAKSHSISACHLFLHSKMREANDILRRGRKWTRPVQSPMRNPTRNPSVPRSVVPNARPEPQSHCSIKYFNKELFFSHGTL